MNFKSLTCALTAAAALFIAAIPAAASTTAITRTNIPFEFVANGKAMPAGAYTISRSAENVMQVRHESGDTALALSTRHLGAVDGTGAPKVVFVKKGGKMHLSEVHLATRPGGEQVAVK